MIARALNTAVEYSGAERTLRKLLSGVCEKLSSETDLADDKERRTFRISGLHRALEDAGGGGYCHLRAGCSGARALPLNAERRP